jgi:hypothetical protein
MFSPVSSISNPSKIQGASLTVAGMFWVAKTLNNTRQPIRATTPHHTAKITVITSPIQTKMAFTTVFERLRATSVTGIITGGLEYHTDVLTTFASLHLELTHSKLD